MPLYCKQCSVPVMLLDAVHYCKPCASKIDNSIQPAICPYFKVLSVCVWRADVKCYAGPCNLMSDKQLAVR